ncbi:MAG: hypothetical protein ACI9S9_003940 [Planctomycetota bacterium]|jgi:hypothetical protein
MSSRNSSNGDAEKASSKQVGLRPAVSASCRAALREVMSDAGKPIAETSAETAANATAANATAANATVEHIEACGFCSARVQARAGLAKWASARPAVPAALASPSLLEGIYERAAEAVEQGPIGAWLEEASVATTEVAAGSDAAPTFLEDCMDETASHNELLSDFVRSPVPPDSQVWSGVCRSILEGVAAERVMRRQTGWRVLLAGAAAVAVVGLLSIQEDAPVQPTIVFTTLDSPPDVAFANARYPSRN